jgi:hypothetical protein
VRRHLTAIGLAAACSSRAAAPTPPAPPAAPAPCAAELFAAAGPVRSAILTEEPGGLIARDAAGAAVCALIAGPVARAAYDPRIGVAWFLRGGRLEALDLGGPARPPIPVVEDMPDLGFDAGPGVDPGAPACAACVAVGSSPRPAVRVALGPAPGGGQLAGPAAARHERDLAIARRARPRLTEAGARLLLELAARPARTPPTPRTLELGRATWPVPPAAGDLDRCDRSAWPRRGCCAGGCRRGFELPALGRVLVVAGRACDCAEDRCRALCVLHDPARGSFAPPSRPERAGPDAAPEPSCHLELDGSGTAYTLGDRRVCTARGCAEVPGRILGWLTPGPTPGALDEDGSACAEGP